MAEGMNGGYSLADIAALMDKRDGNDFLEGNGILIILFFLIFGGGFGGGFGGWGNAWGNTGVNSAALQGALTRSDLTQVAYETALGTKVDNFATEVSNGFHDLNTSMLNGFNGVQMQMAENRYAAQNCCCETNRNIDSLKYENAQNTAAIIQASNANTQRILDTMCENTIQALRDKVAEKDQLLQSAAFQISQQAQTDTIVSRLSPTPTPAYLTCSPYQSSVAAYNMLNGGCGCNGGF